jgi:hypothetical protein
MSEGYVRISGRLKHRTKKAVLIETDDAAPFIPRSVIHGGDETELDSLAIDDELELRVMEWFAEKEGLV